MDEDTKTSEDGEEKMKPSEILINIGRPMAYYPGLAKIMGGVKAAVFFCQLFYWTGKQDNKDGWIFKDQNTIEEETGLSPKEQLTARGELKKRKLIEEREERLNHRMFYRVNIDRFNAIIPKKPIKQPETPIGISTDIPMGDPLIGTTENTTETTKDSEIGKSPISVKTFDPDEPDPINKPKQPKNEPDSVTVDEDGKKQLSHQANINWPVMTAYMTVCHVSRGEDDARIGRESKLLRQHVGAKDKADSQKLATAIIQRFGEKDGYWWQSPSGGGKAFCSLPTVNQIRQHWTRAKEWHKGNRPNKSAPRVYAEEV